MRCKIFLLLIGLDVVVFGMLSNKSIIIDNESRAALLRKKSSGKVLPFKLYETKGLRVVKRYTTLGYCVHDKSLIDDCQLCSSCYERNN